jgi:hypothetical protein
MDGLMTTVIIAFFDSTRQHRLHVSIRNCHESVTPYSNNISHNMLTILLFEVTISLLFTPSKAQKIRNIIFQGATSMTDTSHPTVEQWLASLELTDEAWLALWPGFLRGCLPEFRQDNAGSGQQPDASGCPGQSFEYPTLNLIARMPESGIDSTQRQQILAG